ncbi:MAG TPA: hypothetical protein VIL08_02635 [Limnochorda sp.]
MHQKAQQLLEIMRRAQDRVFLGPDREWRGKIACVGTRDYRQMPEEWRHLFVDAVRWLAEWGYSIATGGAKGADQIAAVNACLYGSKVQLYLPDPDYERQWIEEDLLGPFASPWQVEEIIYDPAKHQHWAESVRKYHPNPAALSPGVFRLMARNYGIVEGAKAVIALPKRRRLPNGQESLGGTGQGIRIAKALGIPVFDLSTPEGRQALREKMAKHPAPRKE